AAFFLKTSSKPGIFVFAALVLLTLVVLGVYAWLIRQPSLEKVTLKNELKGLRDYLKTKEAKRKRLLNAPEMTEAHFQALLPYALSFGQDNNWAADLAADWMNTANRPNHTGHYYPYYLPGFGNKLGTAYTGTAFPASSGGGGGGSFSGGGGSVGGGGGTGGF
ncbi:MAG: hypothetical protein AAFN92_23345, partial [Bacteroidota bacterium]